MKINKEKGFTLIELMIVIAIIGILAGVAMPGYKSYIETAKRQDGISAINEVKLLQESYRYQLGNYADNIAKLGFGKKENGSIDPVSNGGYYDLSTDGRVIIATPSITKMKNDTCGKLTWNIQSQTLTAANVSKQDECTK